MNQPAPGSLAANADQIVFHFDGNNYDPDDIAAVPIAALLAKADRKRRVGKECIPPCRSRGAPDH
ncbi:MAG: hypothetical protein AAFV26_02885, partial [Pseudomonadota bacterium]